MSTVYLVMIHKIGEPAYLNAIYAQEAAAIAAVATLNSYYASYGKAQSASYTEWAVVP